jgi:hypothetical protein
MAGSAQRLTVEELEDRFRAAKDVVERSHCQAIWLLAKGHSTAEVAEIVALTPRWINKLARRYEAEGADALGDRRRGNPGARPLLDETDLEALRERPKTPPDDGGLWSGPKVVQPLRLSRSSLPSGMPCRASSQVLPAVIWRRACRGKQSRQLGLCTV